ncbi:mRNA surveillance protein pelota [Sulfurisphaera ohwakuensis]|uniref:mRNA surveillance protein pelota n=1 Tax=Sulfurisphaera ohwakuensis TaxID=69656 RepID=UPI0036F33765
MKILEFDDKKGIMKLHIENEDDLWILHIILKKGDRVVAKTTRDVSMGRESRRIPMIIKLQVEYTEFQSFTSRLRIHGIILDAPERFGIKGSHHTINLDIGDEIVIEKDHWNKFEVEKIKRQEEKHLKMLIVLVDFDEYLIALPMKQGIRILAEKSLRTPNKEEENIIEENAKEVANEVLSYAKSLGIEVVLLAGPGPFKEIVSNFLKNIKLYVDSVSSATRSGLNEILKRDIIDQISRDYEISEETKIMEKIMENLAKNTGLVAYGKEEVKKSAEYGAVDKLLVIEDLLSSDEEERMEIEKIMEEVENKNGRVLIVPKDSPIYYEVRNLTGLVALLRFRIN